MDKTKAIRLLAELDQHLSKMNQLLSDYLRADDNLAALEYLNLLEDESSLSIKDLLATLREDKRQRFETDEFFLFLDCLASFLGAGHMKRSIFEGLINENGSYD